MVEKNLNVTAEELQALLQETKQYAEAAKADLATARHYRDEARRYRNEAQQSMLTTQITATFLEEEKKNWVIEGIPKPKGLYAYSGTGGNSYVLYCPNKSRGAYKEYLSALLEAGFEKHYEREIGKAIYACYFSDTAVVDVSFADTDRVLRIVVDHRNATALAPTEEIHDGAWEQEPRLLLFGDHLYDLYDCGMGYIFRLRDGSFVIVDGGMPAPDALPESFFARLKELAEGHKIIVSAWFLTHAHPDHTRVFVETAKRHAAEVTVRRVIHNFPGRLMQMGGFHDAWCEQEVRFVEEAIELYGAQGEKPTFIRAHTGQSFRFPDFSVDMLFTLDDFKLPFFPMNFNATSLMFRVTAGEQTFMFLGDSDPTSNGILVERYGELLKSDVVQVAHHGYYGGTKEVYDAIAAPIVLWPVPYCHPKTGDARYNDPRFSPVTREMIRNYARAVYVQYKGTDILSLPLTGEEGITLATGEDYHQK